MTHPLKTPALALAAAAVLLTGCETAYFSAMESVGFAKRDILASPVKSARDSQLQAKDQLVAELNAAIAEADRFIADLERNGA